MAKKKDEVPEDINKELESPKFGKPKSLTNSGYVLDINEKDKKVDLQLYESVQGTSIIEGLNLSKDVKLNDLETDEKKVFKIVGHEEADIENNLLSYKSPVAKELIGKVKNDFVMVNTPKGEKSYEITAIIYK